MKEKDLRRLKRVELLDMLIEQGRLVDAQAEEITKLKAQIEELNRKMEERIVSLERTGSIAEASLRLARVFEAAEDAAKIYLENLQVKSGSDVSAEEALEAAKKRQTPFAEDHQGTETDSNDHSSASSHEYAKGRADGTGSDIFPEINIGPYSSRHTAGKSDQDQYGSEQFLSAAAPIQVFPAQVGSIHR